MFTGKGRVRVGGKTEFNVLSSRTGTRRSPSASSSRVSMRELYYISIACVCCQVIPLMVTYGTNSIPIQTKNIPKESLVNCTKIDFGAYKLKFSISVQM